LPHTFAGRASELEGIARRILVVAGVALVFRPLVMTDDLYAWFNDHPPSLIALTMLAVFVAWPLEALLAAGVQASRQLGPFLALLRNELAALMGIGAAIASTGVLIPLATWEVGLWALPLVMIPLLLAQMAYRRYASIRRTQVQTIRALSRATEVGGYTETGHARRVTELALAIGRDLGLPERRLRLLQYAALMHDLGQLSLTDPIPGGATVLVTPDERRRIAGLGAEVVREASMLEEVAVIVEAQAEPYRRPHLPDDADVPLESRVVKVVNAYDDMVGNATSEDARLEALEALRLGMAYEYDPRVVAALARVLSRAALVPR
jgi:HD domain